MKSKRRLVIGAFLALGFTLAGIGGGWWVYANQVPMITARAALLPSPNAYDDYVAAAGLLATRSARTWDLAKMPADVRRSHLAQNREALERLREGFQNEFWNPPHNLATPAGGDMTAFDTFARLLVLEGQQAEAEGRLHDAAESYLDCLQLGVDLPKGGTFIHALTGAAIQERGLSALQQLGARLDEKTAQHVLGQMRELDEAAPTMPKIIAAERDASLTYLTQMLRTTPPTQVAVVAGFSQNPGMALEYMFTPKRQMLDNYQQYMTAWIERASKPYHATMPTPEMPKDFLSRHFVPANESAWRRWTLRDAQWRVTEASLAMRAYEATHGQPPATLEQLVPKYLPAVPADPFAPQPLAYRSVDGKWVAYSCGPDGDDDRGFQANPKVAYREGDVVRVQPRR